MVGQVQELLIGANGVTTAKIADDAVTTAKVDHNNDPHRMIADDAVTTLKIGTAQQQVGQ